MKKGKKESAETEIKKLKEIVVALKEDRDYFKKRAERLEGEHVMGWEEGYYKTFGVSNSAELGLGLKLGDRVRIIGKVTATKTKVDHETKRQSSEIEVELMGIKKEG
jgi:hypothetical protein